MAWGALIAWPFIAAILFRATHLPVALCATILGGYLLLPVQTTVDLPSLPPLDKNTIPALAALVMTAIVLPNAKKTWVVQPGWLPRNPIALALIALLIVGAFGTTMTNGDGLSYGPVYLPGLRPYDAFSTSLLMMMNLIPFFLARKVLATPAGHRILLLAVVASASAYAVLALYEVRMSPQLNIKVYGFFPSSWLQSMRGGGFRPVVFLGHGLSVGLYLATATIAAFALFRVSSPDQRRKWLLTALWLLGVLILSKAVGALAITLLVILMIFFLPRRGQILVVTAITILILLYPLPRSAGLIPTDRIVSFFEGIDTDRAASLQFRLDNEDILLARALERPSFGWGGYGRNRVFNDRGMDLSTTDGAWVILLGDGGWARYIGEFGLMGFGALVLFFRRRDNLDPASVALALALMANLVDLIPNSGITPLTWMMAGALMGMMELKNTTQDTTSDAIAQANPETERPADGPIYARSHHTPAPASHRNQGDYARGLPPDPAPKKAGRAPREERFSRQSPMDRPTNTFSRKT